MDLELAWLRSWLAVVDAGGFARAASRIYLSQPRVSAHVANLERTLGCTLIDRRARPLTLTDEGQRFLPRARAIIASVDDATADLRSTATTIAGQITLASFASASSEFVAQVVSTLRAQHPLVAVGVLDGDVSMIDAALAERRATVALRPYRPEPTDRGLIRRGLWREPFVLLARDGHDLLEHESLTLEEIAKHPVITIGDPFAGQSLGYEVWTGMHNRQIEPDFGIVSHQPTTLAAMVRAGQGLGLVNLLAAKMVRTDGLTVRAVDAPALHRDVGLWWHGDQPLSRATETFIEFVLAAERPDGTLEPDSD